MFPKPNWSTCLIYFSSSLFHQSLSAGLPDKQILSISLPSISAEKIFVFHPKYRWFGFSEVKFQSRSPLFLVESLYICLNFFVLSWSLCYWVVDFVVVDRSPCSIASEFVHHSFHVCNGYGTPSCATGDIKPLNHAVFWPLRVSDSWFCIFENILNHLPQSSVFIL